MYNNLNNGCNCRSCRERGRDLNFNREGIAIAKEGLRDIHEGFEEINRKNVFCGEKEILKGLRNVEEGIKDIFEILRILELNRECNSVIIREDLNIMREGERIILVGLQDIRNCNVCEGLAELREGIKFIEKGLKDIEETLCDIIRF